ncbi:MAG: Maf family protein [Pseudoxanthomonas sp.]
MFFLASQSPRRAELLTRLGLQFERIDLDLPEIRQPGETAAGYVRRVAQEKAAAGLEQLGTPADAVVLGADTEVVLGDEVFGKPKDVADAAAMLRRLSGRTHRVITAVSLATVGRTVAVESVTEVTFDALGDADIVDYLACGEAMGKAGAYAIQGRAEQFVTRIDGSYSGVMGLPLHETAKLLKHFGVL